MCGRTACTLSADEVQEACRYKSKQGDIIKPNWKNKEKYAPSYNKAPMTYSPTLISKESTQGNEEPVKATRLLEPMRWGLVPSWQQEAVSGSNMINCRQDTITEKKTFAGLLKAGKRCVVLAEGFYEWQAVDGRKQPYFLHTKQSEEKDLCEEKSLIRMAGLYDENNNQDEGCLRTYTVITVDAHPSLKWLHHRMPAILNTDENIEQWLNPKINWEKALSVLKPSDCVDWYPVSSVVNSVKNDTPECTKKIKITKTSSASQNVMSSWLKGGCSGTKRKSSENPTSKEISKKCKTLADGKGEK